MTEPMTGNLYEEFRCEKLKARITYSLCLQKQRMEVNFWGDAAGKYAACPCDQGLEIKKSMEGIMSKRGICKNCEREMAIAQEGLCGGCFCRVKYLEGDDKETALAAAREDFKGKGPVGPGNRAPRKAKVEGRIKKDPASGAIAPTRDLDPEVKVEGLAFIPDGSAPISTRKPDRKAPSGISAESQARDFETLVDEFIIPLANMHLDDSNKYNLPALCRRANEYLENGAVQTFPQVTISFLTADAELSQGLLLLSRKYRRTPDQQILWLLEHELTSEGLLTSDGREAT